MVVIAADKGEALRFCGRTVSGEEAGHRPIAGKGLEGNKVKGVCRLTDRGCSPANVTVDTA